MRIAGTELKTRADHRARRRAAEERDVVGGQAGQPQPGIAAAAAPESLRGDEDLFVDASVDKTKVYVGQQVTASWRLYTQSDILKYRPLAEPKYEDFWSEDLFVPTSHLAWDRSVVKGHEYAVALLLKKALFPLKAGKLAITPLEAEATTMQTAFIADASDARKSQGADGRGACRCPSTGGRPGSSRPTSGTTSCRRRSIARAVKAGEAVTWKVTVRGVGNIRNVRLPKLDKLDGFRVYEPTTKETIEPGDEVHGQKVYTYLLLPQKGGALSRAGGGAGLLRSDDRQVRGGEVAADRADRRGRPDARSSRRRRRRTTENVLGAADPAHPQSRRRCARASAIGCSAGASAIIMLAVPPGAWLLVLIGDALRRRLGARDGGLEAAARATLGAAAPARGRVSHQGAAAVGVLRRVRARASTSTSSIGSAPRSRRSRSASCAST